MSKMMFVSNVDTDKVKQNNDLKIYFEAQPTVLCVMAGGNI